MRVSSRHTCAIDVRPGGRAAPSASRNSSSYGSLTIPSGSSTRLSSTSLRSAAAASMASYDVPDISPMTRIRSTPLPLG